MSGFQATGGRRVLLVRGFSCIQGEFKGPSVINPCSAPGCGWT
jgi:hypothetical protein